MLFYEHGDPFPCICSKITTNVVVAMSSTNCWMDWPWPASRFIITTWN